MTHYAGITGCKSLCIKGKCLKLGLIAIKI